MAWRGSILFSPYSGVAMSRQSGIQAMVYDDAVRFSVRSSIPCPDLDVPDAGDLPGYDHSRALALADCPESHGRHRRCLSFGNLGKTVCMG